MSRSDTQPRLGAAFCIPFALHTAADHQDGPPLGLLDFHDNPLSAMRSTALVGHHT
jgi:hypothetical protein